MKSIDYKSVMAKKPTSFKPATLFPNQALAYIYSKIEHQKQLLQPVRKNLSIELAAHVLHCMITQKKLIIFTDSAVWASQLRFHHDTILASIAASTKESVDKLQVKIISTLPGFETRPETRPIVPSAEKIKLIRNAGLTASDEQLKLALIKLSSTLQSRADER